MTQSLEARLHIWKHNSLCGSLKLARSALRSVITSSCATQEAKDRASICAAHLEYLITEVWHKRLELDGRISNVKHKSDIERERLRHGPKH